MSKMKLRSKHWQIAATYHRFAGFTDALTEADVLELFLYESQGKHSESEPRLLAGKRQYELLIWNILEEVFYYWSRGWGWMLPIVDYSLDGDPLVIAALGKWVAKCEANGILAMMQSNDNVTPERLAGWLAARKELVIKWRSHAKDRN